MNTISSTTFPLSKAKSGQAYHIESVGESLKENSFYPRIIEMGLSPNETIIYVGERFGMYVVRIGGACYAINGDIANNLFISSKDITDKL